MKQPFLIPPASRRRAVRWMALSTLALAGLAGAGAAVAADAAYPATQKRAVQDTFHGTAVSEDYRWLEDFESPEVKQWVAAQNALTRARLDAIPGREALAARIKDLVSSRPTGYGSLGLYGQRWFALKFEAGRQQPRLVTMDSPDQPGTERVVLDPTELATDGSLAIDWFQPSPDGRRIAVSLSEKGSERGSLHLYDVASGKAIDVVIPRVQFPTGGGSVSWHADGKGLLYTRYPAPGERPDADAMFFQEVWTHRLGEPLSRDRRVLGQGLPRIAETFLAAGPKGLQIAQVLNGDGGEEAFWLQQKGGRWQQLSNFADGVKGVQASADGWLYLLSTQGAPKGQVLRLKLGQPLAKAERLVPEAEGTLTQFKLQDGRLYLSYLLGGPSELRRFDLKTRKSDVMPLPPIASVDALVKGAKGELLASVQSYTQPQAWYRVHADGHLEATALAQKANVDFSDVEVLREFATSKDGTRVPLNILRPKGLKLDGSHPVLLYGYGGYSVSQTPGFNALRKVWLERGGVMVIANLRGGGEYGEAWHLAGNLTRKQNVFDDFIGAAEHLIARGYTRPERLAIQGGSNGGLLMGAALTQRPDLFRAVHASVGIYDMLRVELDANGAFNITEFGTVKDEAQFRALLGYSPLHKVRDGTRYPAVLFTTGDHDGRVNPMQSRKMVARLQAAQGAAFADRPILLRTSANAGHGMGSSTSEVIAERTDSFSFLMDQLGMPLQKP